MNENERTRIRATLNLQMTWSFATCKKLESHSYGWQQRNF